MNTVIRMGRRALTAGVVGATIAWSMGLATLVQPLTARAAMAGDLVKGSLPAVYYYASNGQRYVFPNEKTYKTWYADFSGVMTLSDAEISAMPIGGNVVYRAGTRLVKIQTDPRTYAVEPMGVIRWVETEAVALALYGSSWAGRIDDVPDVFFVDYTPGTSVSSAAMYPSGSLVKNAGDPDVYYIDGTAKRWVDPTAMAANRFWTQFVTETTQNLAVYTDGANIAGAEAGLTDAAQLGSAATPVGGGLTVSLASDTPVAATVPLGANSVAMLGVNFGSSGAASTISGIVFKRLGVGAAGNLTNVYLYDAQNRRLTDGRTINAQTNEVTFSGLNISVPAGGTTKLWVRADISALAAAASTQHGFQIEASSKVTSTASSTGGSFPVSGNLFSLAAGTAGTVTIDATGTITNPTLGQDQAEIARFTLASANESAAVTRINLDLDGSARNTDLTNLTLWKGTTKLAEVASVTSTGLISFGIDPAYPLPEGATHTFSVKADIGGDATRTVGIRLEEPGDLWAVGGDFGFNMTVTNAGYNGGNGPDDAARGICDAITDDCSFSTIQGGQLTFAFNGPAASEIAVNSQDRVFMNFSVTARQFVTVQEFQIDITCTVAADCDAADADAGGLIRDAAVEQNIKDVKITKADGSLLMGPLEVTLNVAQDAVMVFTFTEDFTMNAGQTFDLRITGDVDNNAQAANVFTARILMATVLAEDVNGDAVAAANIVPSSNIGGNGMTTRASSLTVTNTTPPSDGLGQTTIRGTSSKDSVAYSFAAGNASDVTVTNLTLMTSVDGDIATDQGDFIVGTETEADGGVMVAARDMLAAISIYDGDTQALIAGPESVLTTPAGAVTFDSFTWMIPAGQTKKLLVKANIANAAVLGENDAYAFRIAAIGDVTAQDADGNAAPITLGTNNGTAAAPTVFIRVADSGTITVSQDPGTTRPDILLGGATDVTVSKFRFDATNEAMLVKRITIAERGSVNNGVSDDGALNVTLASGYANNVSSIKLSYQKQDGTTATATGFLTTATTEDSADADAVADMTSMMIFNLPSGSEFYVPANGNRTLTVMMSLPTIDSGATTGEKPQLDLDVDATADDQFEAVGASSGVTLDDDNATDAAGRQHVVRETQPTISLAAGSPTQGSPGLSEVFRFTVAAAAGEAVVLDVLTFKMTSSDNNGDTGTAGIADEWNTCDQVLEGDEGSASQLATGDFSFFDAAAPSTALEAGDADWALLTATGAACADDAATVGFARLNLTTPEVVAPGTTRTYQLKVDTTGAASANDDSVRFEIVNEPIVMQASFLAASDLNEANLTPVDTTLTVTASAGYTVGDLLCMDTADNGCAAGDEVMLLLAIPDGTTLTVYRGDLGTLPDRTAANDAADDIDRIPASLVWDDDGSTVAINEVSAYLVDTLDVVGATIVY